jgi:pyruvate,orthophosphate dikinase
MLGHRGCRLAVTYPEIYDMQVEAIALAAVECLKQKIPVRPEIMIPIVITARELKLLRPNAEAVLKRVFDAAGTKVPVKIGTMIEVPRAALRSAHIARYADFFSFGTNDLTQMTFAFSRDDVASFMPSYLEKVVLDVDPFKSIDEDGVGFLVATSTEQGRSVKPDLKVGICGEHGGDPATIDFCFRSGLSYVSCSPFRVPLARLAGAQAVLNNPPAKAKPAAAKTAKAAADKKPAAKKAPAKKAAAAKGKRGRPATKKTAATAAAEKKPRGRPATKKTAATAVAEKKPRGRPPVKKTADAAAKSAVKKPRGRPATKKTADAAAKSTVKKPRGRPPVRKTGAPKKSKAAKSTVKKPRGRPPVKKAGAKKTTPKRIGDRAAKSAVKKPVVKKAAERKNSAIKAAAKKPVAKKAPVKKTVKKAKK